MKESKKNSPKQQKFTFIGNILCMSQPLVKLKNYITETDTYRCGMALPKFCCPDIFVTLFTLSVTKFYFFHL